MKNVTNKKTAAGWIAAALSFAVLVAGLTTGLFYLDRQSRANRIEVENVYQQNIYQMSQSVANIEVNMSKLMVSKEKTETALLLNDTYHHSATAINALNVLPIDPWDKAVTERFLNQLGDWCLAMSKKISNGGFNDNFEESGEAIFVFAPSGDNTKNALAAQKDSQNARKRLEDFDEQSEELYLRTKKLAASVRQAADRFVDGYKVINNLSRGLMNGFDVAAEDAANDLKTPEIVYDGPFSDKQDPKNFKGLAKKEEISAPVAMKKAEEIFKNMGLRNLSLVGETDSPAAYALYGNSNFGDMYVNMSKKGGVVLLAGVPCDNSGKQVKITEEKCKELAVKYADMCGYSHLSPVWSVSAAGFVLVNLAPIVDGVVIYPDLVKIKVCMVTGDFKAIEATGFCTCNCQRDLTAALSQAEAQKAVNNKLTVTDCRLALIPKDGKEILCYEFAAEYNGLDYFVYVDANTGKQANIMRLKDGVMQ